jgi:hypothetical protein
VAWHSWFFLAHGRQRGYGSHLVSYHDHSHVCGFKLAVPSDNTARGKLYFGPLRSPPDKD